MSKSSITFCNSSGSKELKESPEINLYASVIDRAILDLTASEDVIRRDAYKWLMRGNTEPLDPLTFPWMLQVCGIDLSHLKTIRDELKRIRGLYNEDKYKEKRKQGRVTVSSFFKKKGFKGTTNSSILRKNRGCIRRLMQGAKTISH